MAHFKLKGKATIDGAVQKNFEVVVKSNDPNFSVFGSRQEEAVRQLHPDWKAICVQYSEKLS